MTATSEHLLYKAAVSFMVSERTSVESWELVAKFASRFTDNGDVAALKKEFAVVEQQIKADFKIDALPSAWRSAKSVAVKAVKSAVRLVDSHTGAVKGKTAVENECKPVGVPTATAATPEDKFFAALSDATHTVKAKGFEFSDEAIKQAAVESVTKLLAHVKGTKVK